MSLRVAFVPGVTVTKWTRTWAERHPSEPLELLPVAERDQLAAVMEDRADVCFVRLPIEREGLNVIRLYGEVPVVVLGKDHPLWDASELDLASLADDTTLSIADSAPPGAAPGADADSDPTKQAVELVAAGVGVLVLPHSVARLYSRKDVRAVPLTDAEETEIALVWPTEATSDEIDDWVGIVRGRTAASSRGRQPDAAKAEGDTKKPPKKQPASSKGGRRPAGPPRRPAPGRKPRRRR